MRLPGRLILWAGLFLAPHPAEAQAFNIWLNARRDTLVRARIEARDGTKEVGPVSASASNSSLVDRAAMPDVAGISIHLPGQPRSAQGGAPTPTSFSATPFMLLALLKGTSPLDPSFYLGSAWARRVGLNATFDTDSSGHTTTALQFKVLILDRGNPFAGANADRLRGALGGATSAFGALRANVLDTLYDLVGKPANMGKPEFINSLGDAGSLRDVLARAGEKGISAVDRAIERFLDPFLTLQDSVAVVIMESRRRPELSLGGTYKREGATPELFHGLLIFDWTARQSLDLTLNAGMEHLGKTATVAASTRAELAGQLLWRLTPDNTLTGKNPLSFALAGSSAFGTTSSGSTVLKLQAKLLLPIAEGVNVPFSATWANRGELIDEARINGQVGFTFDVAQILSALRLR